MQAISRTGRLQIVLILALVAAALAGCRLSQAESIARSSGPEAAPAATTGRLAFIGGDGNVYLTAADGGEPRALTRDATASPEGSGLSYHRISWAPDGRLAFASVQRAGDEAQSRLFVLDALDAKPRLVGESEDHFVIYIYWAPAPCPGRLDCRHLAYLIEEADGIALRLVELEQDAIINRRLGLGWPFYFSWAPDARSMLWHTGGALRHNRDARVVHYDLTEEEIRLLDHQPGSFLAPAWSPKGDRWLSVSAEGSRDLLQSFGPTEPETIASAQDSSIVFAWSPDGGQVAYAVRDRPNDPFFGPIQIYDLATRTSTRITDVGFRILGFFWSPDGRKLGYLTWQTLPRETWMQWRVYNLSAGADRGFKLFHPSQQWRFVISSFNQYAQSHRFWSPDSRYLVYADRDRDQVERIWTIDTLDADGTNARLIGEGSLAVWSWE